MDFTKTEWELITHRLLLKDAIIDVFEANVYNGLKEYDYDAETIEAKIVELEKQDGNDVDMNDTLTKLLIEDSCEGSTFFCDIEDAVYYGDITHGQKLAYYRARNSVEKKLGVEFGY